MCPMAIALDSFTHIAAGGTSGVLTTVGTSNLLLFTLSLINSGQISTLTDNSGVTAAWALVTGAQVGAGVDDLELWWTKTTGTVSGPITITPTPTAATFKTFDLFAISGADTTSPFDGSAINGTTDPLSITTSVSAAMLVGGFRFAGTANPTAGSGYSTISGADFMMSEHKEPLGAGTYSFTVGTGVGDANGGVVVAVKQAAAAGGFKAAWARGSNLPVIGTGHI